MQKCRQTFILIVEAWEFLSVKEIKWTMWKIKTLWLLIWWLLGWSSLVIIRRSNDVFLRDRWFLCTLYWEIGRIPKNKSAKSPWACTYKGKSSRMDCVNYRAMNLLSLVAKYLYGKVIEMRMQVKSCNASPRVPMQGWYSRVVQTDEPTPRIHASSLTPPMTSNQGCCSA